MPKATTEEKLAKSTGGDTEKYSKELDAEADDLINKTYHPDKEEEDKKKVEEAEAKKAEEDKEKELEETEKEEAEKKETERLEAEKEKEKEKEKEDMFSIEIQEGETVESMKEKSEKRIKEAQGKMTKATQDAALSKKEKDAANTLVGTLQSTIENLQTRLETAPKTEKEKETETKPVVLDISKEMEVLNKLDPEMAKPVQKIVDGLVGKITDLSTKLTEKTKSDEQRAIKTDEENHFGIIKKAHSDFEKIDNSEEFTQWIEGLPPREKRLAQFDREEGKAEDIVTLLTDYKKAVGLIEEKKPDVIKEEKNNDKLKKAKGLANPTFKKQKDIKTGTVIKYTRSMIDAMSPEEYAEKEKDIDKEMAAGRIGNN